jgi:hypothetical protein
VHRWVSAEYKVRQGASLQGFGARVPQACITVNHCDQLHLTLASPDRVELSCIHCRQHGCQRRC